MNWVKPLAHEWYHHHTTLPRLTHRPAQELIAQCNIGPSILSPTQDMDPTSSNTHPPTSLHLVGDLNSPTPNGEPPYGGNAVGPRQEGLSSPSHFMDRGSTNVNMAPSEVGRGSHDNIDQPRQMSHPIEEMSNAPSGGAHQAF